MIAAVASEGAGREAGIDRAVALAERASADFGRPTSIALAVEARWIRSLMRNSSDDLDAALDHARHLTEVDPHGIGSWRRLGDILWESGRLDDASDAYRRALQADAAFELDPLKRLSDRDRETLRQRIFLVIPP